MSFSKTMQKPVNSDQGWWSRLNFNGSGSCSGATFPKLFSSDSDSGARFSKLFSSDSGAGYFPLCLRLWLLLV